MKKATTFQTRKTLAPTIYCKILKNQKYTRNVLRGYDREYLEAMKVLNYGETKGFNGLSIWDKPL